MDRAFVTKLVLIALPITLQNMMFSSRSLVDVVMLGQLGENEVAAMGIAARAAFVATIMLVGITTAGSMLTAQHWGAGDESGVRRSTALTWLIATLCAIGTVGIFILFPSQIIGFATDSAEVVALGSEYLQYAAFSMLGVACVASMAVGLRSVHQPGVSAFFSCIGIVVNVTLNWLLIFGHYGFPRLGIVGAALATTISSAIEVVCLFSYLHLKRHLLAFSIQDLLQVINRDQIQQFFSLSLPTTLNYFVWSAGLYAYQAIMGQTGLEGLAALAVMVPIESMALALAIGLSMAGSVLVGNELGAQRYENVYFFAWGIIVINIVVSVVVALCVYFASDVILGAFSALTGPTKELAEQFILVMCVGLVLRSLPMMATVGVLRAGGDVKYCLYQDLTTQWGIGIPCAALGAIWLGWSPVWVYTLFLVEEVIKWVGCVWRIRGKKWVKHLL